MITLISLIAIVFCCLVIWKACDGFEVASEFLGRNLSEGVRGATINAIGSSIPELFTTIFFLLILHNQEGFSGGIGTTAGSAIFNAVVIPSMVILAVIFAGKIAFVKVSKRVVLRDGIMLLLSEFALIFLLSGGTLYWWHGLILMILYGIYVVVLFSTMRKNKDDEEEDDEDDDEDDDEYVEKGFLTNLFSLNLEGLIIRGKEITTPKAWTLLLSATAVVGAASALLVVACENLGNALDIPVYFVAVILAAAATSVPDTFLSIKDAQKGNYDDAVSNALGSNIFDICFALGFPLFLYTLFVNPIKMEGAILSNVNELRSLLLILTALVFLIFLFSKKLKKQQGILLLAIYVFFVCFILSKSIGLKWIQPIEEFLRNLFAFLS